MDLACPHNSRSVGMSVPDMTKRRVNVCRLSCQVKFERSVLLQTLLKPVTRNQQRPAAALGR